MVLFISKQYHFLYYNIKYYKYIIFLVIDTNINIYNNYYNN